MKLKEMTDAVAAACDMKPRAVASVQQETFRLINEAIEKGERVVIPGFGSFMSKELPQEGGAPKTVVRFRRKSEDVVSAPDAGESGDAAKEEKKQRRDKRRTRRLDEVPEPASGADPKDE